MCKDNVKSVKDVGRLQEITLPVIKITAEVIMPNADPANANRFPHKLASQLFLIKTREPTAPIMKEDSIKKKLIFTRISIMFYNYVYYKEISILSRLGEAECTQQSNNAGFTSFPSG